jgi:hypothetical protein
MFPNTHFVFAVEDDGKDPLNISLSSFTSIITPENDVILRWRTASETNVNGFEVLINDQNDRANANRISGLIKATNTSVETDYSFTDTEANLGISYYWIAMLGNDGTVLYSNPIVVNVEDSFIPEMPEITTITSVYPNPMNTGRQAHFNVEVKNDEVAKLQIFNIRGQLVNETTNIPAGHNQILWEGRDRSDNEVATGVYFYRLSSQSSHTVGRIVIIR